MAERTGTCSKCGAKYRIPATFKGTRAKCKKCGGIVEIPPREDKERAPEKSPKGEGGKAPVAAAKKPSANLRAGPSRKTLPSRRGARGASAGRAGRSRSAARRTSSRRHESEEKEGGTPNWVWIVAGVSLVGIVILLIVLFSGGNKEPSPADLASLNAGGGAGAETVPEEQPKTQPKQEPNKVEPKKEQPPAPAPKKEEKKAPTPAEIPKDAKDVDPIIKFEPLPPIIGCDDATFKKLTDCFVKGFLKEDLPPWKRKPLKKEFDKAGFEKIPILINAFNGLDLLKPDDVVVAFRVAEMWNALTGKGFVDIPIKGDTTREEMEANLPLNVKNIYAIYNIWSKKVGDVKAQRSFIAKCEKHKAAAAEKEQ